MKHDRLSSSPWWLGLLVVALAAACTGSSPTEVVEAEPPVVGLIERGVPDGPGGEYVGCPCPRDPSAPLVCTGPYKDLATVDPVAGTLAMYQPPDPTTNCVTTSHNNRFTMKVDLQLPPALIPDSHLHFKSGDFSWLCPVPGSVGHGDGELLFYSDNWSFHVFPSGHLVGKCIFVEVE